MDNCHCEERSDVPARRSRLRHAGAGISTNVMLNEVKHLGEGLLRFAGNDKYHSCLPVSFWWGMLLQHLYYRRVT